MWKLFTEHGHADGYAREDGLAEGGADAQPVNEVVDPVAEYDHPSYRCYPVARRQILHAIHGGPEQST